jgi:hypothetical protein
MCLIIRDILLIHEQSAAAGSHSLKKVDRPKGRALMVEWYRVGFGLNHQYNFIYGEHCKRFGRAAPYGEWLWAKTTRVRFTVKEGDTGTIWYSCTHPASHEFEPLPLFQPPHTTPKDNHNHNHNHKNRTLSPMRWFQNCLNICNRNSRCFFSNARPNISTFNATTYMLVHPVTCGVKFCVQFACKVIRDLIPLPTPITIKCKKKNQSQITLEDTFFLFPFFSRGVLWYFTQTWQNNSFWCLLRRLPRPQDVGHLCLRYCKKINQFYNLNCSAQERAPWRRVTEKSHFSTLNVGLAGTGNRTQAASLEAQPSTTPSGGHLCQQIVHGIVHDIVHKITLYTDWGQSSTL